MIKVDAKALSGALAMATRIAPARNTIPILSHALISAVGGTMSIQASDLERHAYLDIPAEGDLAPVAVHADRLSRIAKSMEGAVRIGADDGALMISAGRSRHKLLTLEADQFPAVRRGEPTAEFDISGAILARVLGRPIPAASTEETRYYLNGVYLHTVEGMLTGVATDGVVLVKTMSDFEPPEFEPVIVPTETCRLVLRLCSDDSGVKVSISDRYISVSDGRTSIFSKLIAGSYPDYQRATPDDPATFFEIDHSVIEAALNRVIVTSGSDDFVLMSLEGDCVRLTSDDPGTGVSCVEISADIETAETGAVSVGFKDRNMRRALSATENGDAPIRIGLQGGSFVTNSPISITSVGNTEAWVWPMMPPARMAAMPNTAALEAAE